MQELCQCYVRQLKQPNKTTMFANHYIFSIIGNPLNDLNKDFVLGCSKLANSIQIIVGKVLCHTLFSVDKINNASQIVKLFFQDIVSFSLLI